MPICCPIFEAAYVLNIIVLFVSIMDEKDEVYNRAVDEIQSITELIDKDLNFQND